VGKVLGRQHKLGRQGGRKLFLFLLLPLFGLLVRVIIGGGQGGGQRRGRKLQFALVVGCGKGKNKGGEGK